ncbi:MAG: quinone-dependent dihydroorotate dehydrogenase [Prochlorotrichaceae cyanobacterium]
MVTSPYHLLLRPLLFSILQVDPEATHRLVMEQLESLSEAGTQPWGKLVRSLLQANFATQDDRFSQTLWNVTFPNPIGLAAGFDKDGEAIPLWSDFGFGFIEAGTITAHAQPGNPQPRLFRLLADEAVLNRMGFNNDGAQVFRERLQHWAALYRKTTPQRWPIPLGINLGKSKVTPLEEAIEDYRLSFQTLGDWGDYFVINVSSPNTPGLRNLQAREQLEPLCAALQAENQQQRPLFVKIAPDLDWTAIEDVMTLVQEYHLSGIIATNTTLERSRLGLKTQVLKATGRSITEEAGGISGSPLRQRSTAVIRFIAQQSRGQIPIIGVGGIFSAEDAWEKIAAGACLVQVYTGWIYEGPWMIKAILQGLGKKLEDRGFKHISEAIGSEVW